MQYVNLYLPSAVYNTKAREAEQITETNYSNLAWQNIVKNPNWPDVNQLVGGKRIVTNTEKKLFPTPPPFTFCCCEPLC